MKNLIDKNNSAELEYKEPYNSREKYELDSPMDRAFISYLVMLLCAVVDGGAFISLFQIISYDSPMLIVVEVAGLLFGFDVVPIYLGIAVKKLRQKLDADWFVVWFGLAVFALACVINVTLRIITIDQIAPDLSSVAAGYFEEMAEESNNNINSNAVALTIFGIVLPIITSVGSFFICYVTFHPLRKRVANIEKELARKKDEIRRLTAIVAEYEADDRYAEHLQEDDDGKYIAAYNMTRALVLGYCDYVRLRLKEHIGEPAATNSLSESCVGMLQRLDEELQALSLGNNISKADIHEGGPII